MADSNQPRPTSSPTSRPTRFRTGGLSPRKPTAFDHHAGAEELKALAADLGLLSLRGLRLTGEIAPNGPDEIVLTAQLVADADQACVVTLVPVRARINDPVRRRFVADLSGPAGDEVEIPEDDTLALALPLYPRAPGAELGTLVAAPDGVAPLSDADLKPFAGLAALARKTPPDTGGAA